MAKIAQEAVVSRRLGPTIDSITSGESVSFGSIVLSREGITAKDETIDWSTVGEPSVKEGEILLSRLKDDKQQRWIRATYGATPNVELLFAVIAHFRSTVGG